ncbi:hypothetical protein PUN28_019636 [Cardiocondyla obscurior]|uniref:Uncharacterized protein n=1 Tax=Cardiocondyla obscurior TaxID=286306 RepID=A0AAW2EBN2_9HYME
MKSAIGIKQCNSSTSTGLQEKERAIGRDYHFGVVVWRRKISPKRGKRRRVVRNRTLRETCATLSRGAVIAQYSANVGQTAATATATATATWTAMAPTRRVAVHPGTPLQDHAGVDIEHVYLCAASGDQQNV